MKKHMKLLKCLFSGGHTWDRCKCEICGRTKDDDHLWSRSDCGKCTICGRTRDDGHDWSKDCGKCARCGQARDDGHDWSDDCGKCAICGKTRDVAHDWSTDRGKCFKCTKCSKARDYVHDWGNDYSKCNICGKLNNIIQAAVEGNVTAAKVLLADGSDINMANEFGETALAMASESGHLEFVEMLLANGTEVNAKRLDGSTALFFASAKGFTNIVDLLVANYADVDVEAFDGNTPLMSAAVNGHLNIVIKLMAKGADATKKRIDGATAASLAASNGHEEVVAKLKAREKEIEEVLEVIEMYHRAKKHIPLYEVVRIAKDLLKQEDFINAFTPDSDESLSSVMSDEKMRGMTFRQVVMVTYDSCADLLNLIYPIVVFGNATGRTELPQDYINLLNVVIILFDNISKICFCSGEIHALRGYLYWLQSHFNKDNSALHKAHEAFHKANLYTRSYNSKWRSAESGTDSNCYNILWPNTDDFLIKVAYSGDLKGLLMLLSIDADVNAKSSNGSTALIYAVMRGHEDIVAKLIKNGADVNAKRPDGDTALFFAVTKGSARIVDLLIANGADVNVKNSNGDTALSLAAANGHMEIVALLIANGADMDTRKSNGTASLIPKTLNGQTVEIAPGTLQSNPVLAAQFSSQSDWRATSPAEFVPQAVVGAAYCRIPLTQISNIVEKLSKELMTLGVPSSEMTYLFNNSLIGICPECHQYCPGDQMLSLAMYSAIGAGNITFMTSGDGDGSKQRLLGGQCGTSSCSNRDFYHLFWCPDLHPDMLQYLKADFGIPIDPHTQAKRSHVWRPR